MRVAHRITLSTIVAAGLFLASLPLCSFSQAAGLYSFAEETHAGTFEDPRLIEEPAWKGAVFIRPAGEKEQNFYVAGFDSEPDKANPPFPELLTPQTIWIDFGRHSGTGTDLKPFNERTYTGALHEGPIEGKRALLRSKFDGTPNIQTPYPTLPEDTKYWEFLGVFEKAGTVEEMKNDQDLVWPGAYVLFTSTNTIYVALRIGHPVADKWPAPDTTEAAGYWKYAGASSDIPDASPKPWSSFSTHAGSYYRQAATPERQYYYSSTFTGFPAVLGAAFPEGAQSNRYWNYRGHHAGTRDDPKAFGEPTWPGAIHRALIEGKLAMFASRFEGTPSAQTPYPTTLTDNDYWQVVLSDNTAHNSLKTKNAERLNRETSTQGEPVTEEPGTFESPRHWDDYSQPGDVYVDISATGKRSFYISRFEGYPADDIDSFSTIGQADPNWVYAGEHAGVLTDIKPFEESTYVGAIHEGEADGQRVLFRSRFDGKPSVSATPYPTGMNSNEHWELIGVFTHAGTASDLKGSDDMTWPGALHLDPAQQLIFASTRQADRPGHDGWVYPVGETSDENWTFVTSVANAGTVETPRGRNGLSKPGDVFAEQRGLSGKKLYRSNFTGFAQDVGAVYPPGTDSNGFYEYLGEHAGTFTDPKPFTEPTWPGAIHQTTIDGHLAFLKSKITGMPGSATPYPETLASNGSWEFEFSTLHAGTITDPQQSMNEETWPGAVHQYAEIAVQGLYTALKFGNPAADDWPAPVGGIPGYWKRIGTMRHLGTFADPKDFSEVTSQGLIHTTEIEGETVYLRSLVQGVPADNKWEYPTTNTGNEYWEYLGKNKREGTWEDPKGADDFTWPGRIHSVWVDDRNLYLISKVDGLPAEHDWPFPQEGMNAYWSVAGESLHSGEVADPKGQQEVTWVGAIHMKQNGATRTYYRSKVNGNLAGDNSFPLPETNTSNAWWEFVGVATHTGTLEDPLVGNEMAWPGALHTIRRAEQDEYYKAMFSGVADATHAYPPTGTSNDNWTYVGKSRWPGTLSQPKGADEITWSDAIHRFETGGKAYYVRSKINGVPPDSGWVFPTPPSSDEDWDYLDMGVHAGTWDDPKPIVDATWPGAIHVAKSTSSDNSPIEPRAFFRSKFWGHASDHPGGYLNGDAFDLIGYSHYKGTLDSPKSFDQPTWTGAIHLDTTTHYFFEAKKAGEMGVDVGEHPTTPTDNDSWHFLGINKHSGTPADPKDWEEYTWPGRIHRYEYGGKVLFFSALMTGTPSEHNRHYPTDESSNDSWAFYGSTEHAGTFADPHQWNEVTWKGAIHQVVQPGKVIYFAAKLPGNSQAENRPYPTAEADNSYWTYVATGTHAGTVEDPKNLNEPVWPGVLVTIQRQTGIYYYVAKNDGIPSANNWTLPDGASSDENWDYFGASLHAGTQNDPKEWTEVTWPGAIHDYQVKSLHLFFSAKKAGVPSDNDWTYPTQPVDNNHWHFENYTDLSGTFDWPKEWGDETRPGLIHAFSIANQTMYFTSTFSQPAGLPPSERKARPDGPRDTEWWKFMRRGNGKATIPNTWTDYSLVGDINEYNYFGKHLLFRAKQEGRPSGHNWYYPTSEVDNDHWEYLYSHAGTFDDPKDWSELTYVGDVHRYEYDNQTYFFIAKKEGNPAKQGWHYPTGPSDNEYWTYAGLHAGTWQDPKTWEEPTWPGALHQYPEKNQYFISNVTGNPAEHNWYYPTSATTNSNWQYFDTSRYTAPGINDFSKPFDQYTWVTAHNGYLDAFAPQLQRGVRGFMLDLHYDHSTTDPQIRMCHEPQTNQCTIDSPSLTGALNNTFLPYLQGNRNAVITLMFESYVSHEDMAKALEAVPGLADYIYAPSTSTGGKWPTLQEMINNNKRIVMFSDNNTSGAYRINGKSITILAAAGNQVENTYNLGNTALTHDWGCESRYGDMALSLRRVDGTWIRTFVLNQFHAFGGSPAHARDKDNNLTWLQRRVERDCGEPTGWRKPNYLAIDFNQVGDAFPYAAALSQGGLYFYEGNGADRDRDTTCVLPGNQHRDGNGMEYDLSLPSNGCENDEIRSMELEGISAGTRIELYDNRQGGRQDDFTLIDVKQSVPMGERVRIDSLEGSSENFWYRKLAFRNNGLDGKISRIRVRPTPAAGDFSDAMIIFHEGTNATQNVVCTVPYNTDQRFKMGAGNNSFGCDNDEIQSATIVKAKAGGYFALTGSPEGGFSQGLAEVRVKKDILTPVVIGNFEGFFENEFVEVRRCYDHELGGKISFGYFYPDPSNGGIFTCNK